MEWLLGEGRVLCQSSATPNIITRYKMSRDYAYYKTKQKQQEKKLNTQYLLIKYCFIYTAYRAF